MIHLKTPRYCVKKSLRIVRKRAKHAMLLRYGVVLWDYQIKKFNLKGE
ncbi:hypothetical protein [Campylobacter coli]|nr:hypothetical protein [Campylobacter coli]